MQVKSISAILLNFIKLPFVIKISVLSIIEWPFYTGFAVLYLQIDMEFSNQYKDELLFSKNKILVHAA